MKFSYFWWNEELNLLTEASVDSHRVWIQVDKPRDGPLFRKTQACRMQYRKCLRDSQNTETVSYTNNLHDALLQKMGKRSGNAGAPSLRVLTNVFRLTVKWTRIVSLTILLIISRK